MSTFSVAAPVRVSAAGQRGGSAAGKGMGRPAFMGRATAGGKASLGDAFAGLSLNTPARKQAQRGVSICGACPGLETLAAPSLPATPAPNLQNKT